MAERESLLTIERNPPLAKGVEVTKQTLLTRAAFKSRVAARAVLPPKVPHLTISQRRVLVLVARGELNDTEIGKSVGIGRRNVTTYLGKNTDGRTRAVVNGLLRGDISFEEVLSDSDRATIKNRIGLLTDRQNEILESILDIENEGGSDTAPSSVLFISPRTVDTHLGKIYRKLGVHNKTRAVIYRLYTRQSEIRSAEESDESSDFGSHSDNVLMARRRGAVVKRKMLNKRKYKEEFVTPTPIASTNSDEKLLQQVQTLTDAERRVLIFAARGQENPYIAESLGITRNTVGTHIEHILEKMSARGRAEAVVKGLLHGVISFDDVLEGVDRSNIKCRLSLLTSKECEVLDYLTKDEGELSETRSQLAEVLFISPRTVSTHLQNIYEKLGVRNKTQAITYYLYVYKTRIKAAEDDAVRADFVHDNIRELTDQQRVALPTDVQRWDIAREAGLDPYTHQSEIDRLMTAEEAALGQLKVVTDEDDTKKWAHKVWTREDGMQIAERIKERYDTLSSYLIPIAAIVDSVPVSVSSVKKHLREASMEETRLKLPGKGPKNICYSWDALKEALIHFGSILGFEIKFNLLPTDNNDTDSDHDAYAKGVHYLLVPIEKLGFSEDELMIAKEMAEKIWKGLL